MVGEQSDWLRDQNRQISTKYHGDPGWNDGTYTPAAQAPANTTPPTAAAGGWISGTEGPEFWVDRGSNITPTGSEPGSWVSTSLFNITTVRYKPNLKEVMGATPLPGCGEVMGHNNPLHSAHPGGTQILLADASARFIDETVDFVTVLKLCIRHDSQPVEVP